jgi:8-oxo-dGTP diphosphatase
MTDQIDVAKVLIQNNEGKFLMLKKSGKYSGHYGERWEPPGGKIEDGEDRFEAAVREVEEETELEIESLDDLVRIELEDEEIVNCYVMRAEQFDGTLVLSEEHSEYEWVTPEEFRTMEWHRDSGHIMPVMVYLKEYLSKNHNY